jgi:outer membrane protein TolC
MFQNDYIMRMILQLVEAIRRSLQQGYASRDEEIESIEHALGDAMDLDPSLALNLEPASLVSVLDLGNFDDQLGGYVTRSLYYQADLLDAEGKTQRASLRRAQADAIAARYNIEITRESVSPEELEAFFAETPPGGS